MELRSNYSIPISATQAAPRVPLATSAGIRAPLTVDENDDFEYSESSVGRKGSFFGSFSSDSGIESDGFVSGEDGFETASSSDRVLVADLDDIILEDTHFVREHVVSMPAVKKHFDSDSDESSSVSHLGPDSVGEGGVSRPIVNSHSGENFDESTSINQLRISRHLLIDPDEELLEGNDSSEEFSESRPFVANLEEDGAVGTSSEEGENDSLAGLPIVDNTTELPVKQGIPIAQLSWDTSDDDFVSDDMSWDGSVSGAVKVGDLIVMEKSQDTPAIVSDVEKVEYSALDICLAEGNYVPSGSHDGLMNTMENRVEDSILDVTKDHAANNLDGVNGAEVNEEFEELESNSLTLTSDVSQKLGSEHVVQKSDLEIEFHDVDSLTNIEVFNISTRKKESQGLENTNLEETSTAERSESLGINSHAADMIQCLVKEDGSVSGTARGVDFVVLERSQDDHTVVLDVEKVKCSTLDVCLADENYAPSGSHDGVIMNTMENIVGDSILDVTENNAADYSDEVRAEVNEEFQELESNSFIVSSIASENLESDQVVQKSDWEVEIHANTSTMERESQSLENSNLGETQTAERSESLGNDSCAADMIQSFVMEDEYYSGSEASHALLQNFDVDSSPIVGIKNDSIFSEEEHNLHYDESLNSDVMDGTVLSEHLLSHLVNCEEEFRNNMESVDAQTISEAEELEAPKDPEGTEMSPTQAGLNLAAGVGSDATHVMFKPNEGTSLSPLELPGDSGTTNDLLVPDAHPDHRLLASHALKAERESEDALTVEEKKKLMKLQQLRIKFLRLVQRLKQPLDDNISAKVLHKLILAAGSPSAQSFSFDLAKQTAMQLEAEGEGQLDFPINILVIGKSGTGKSATINSLLGKDIATTDPFQPCTNCVKEIKGTVNGLQVRLLDTPGLTSYPGEQFFNHNILMSVKRHMKKFPPDVVLYVDRLDMHYKDFNDIPLLKTVTQYLGSSIWFKTIGILTHATSTPPEVSSGSTLSSHLFVTCLSQAVQQLVNRAAGGLHVIKPFAIPVLLVENQCLSEPEENKDMLLPDGSSWREKLLFLCCSLKILSEMDSIIKPKPTFNYRRFLGFKNRFEPVTCFFPSLLQSNAQPNFFSSGDDANFDVNAELAYSLECDQWLPFNPLGVSQIAKLNKDQGQGVFEGYDYAMKLDQEKQMTVSFPAYRYQLSKSPLSHMATPILGFHGWDHECDDDGGVSIEDSGSKTDHFPRSIAVQLRKEKKEFTICLNSSRVSIKADFNSKKSKRLSFRINTSEDLPIAILGFVPIAKMLFRCIFAQSSER